MSLPSCVSIAPSRWRSAAFREWTSIENAALEHYLDGGWSGAAAEGGLILTVIKAASFARLAERNAATYIEALYAQNVAFDEDRYAIGDLLASVSSGTVVSEGGGHGVSCVDELSIGQDGGQTMRTVTLCVPSLSS